MKPLMPSRGMISGEISCAFFAVCFALWGSGIPGVGDGWLYRKLVAVDHPTLWSLSLGLPAIGLFLVGVRELRAHTRCLLDCASCWTAEEMNRSATWRGRFCLAAIWGWAYMTKVILVDIERNQVFAIAAVGACALNWWFYKENRRVRREIRNRYVPCRVAPAA